MSHHGTFICVHWVCIISERVDLDTQNSVRKFEFWRSFVDKMSMSSSDESISRASSEEELLFDVEDDDTEPVVEVRDITRLSLHVCPNFP